MSSIWMLVIPCILFPSACFSQRLAFGLQSFGLSSERDNPCEEECQCYDVEESRFVVNCTGMKFGLFQDRNIPKGLPFNTTDLIVSEYMLGTLSMSSFPNYDFSLNPMLLNVSLKYCHITYLSSDTFQGNSFVSIRNVTLSNNLLDLIAEGTFNHLPYIENISMDNNFLQKVQRAAFKNLPRVHSINLSHNSISEIQQGAFDNLPLLTTLDLSYNWLTSIPGEDISQLPSLKSLYLDGNTWNCSCEMSWILNFSHMLNQSQAMCRYPITLNGTALHMLTVQDFQYCFTSDSMPLRVSASIMAIVCTTILVICASGFVSYQNKKEHNFNNKIQIGQIEFDRRDILASKNNVTIYEGRLLDNRRAAIKKYPLLTRLRELDVFLHLSKNNSPPNPNVVQYLCVETDSKHTYVALELCRGNLKTLIFNHDKLHRYLTPECCLLQMACGIKFLHDQKIQHRDIKPQNILWKYSEGTKIRFIISDFDLSHLIESESSGKCGSEGWSAPELWNRGQISTAVDIFSLGCVFYYALTLGKHPFGPVSPRDVCQRNIDGNKCTLRNLSENHDDYTVSLAEDLISQMIATSASRRPAAGTILDHPLFWGNDKVVDFYHRIGNHMEDLKNSSSVKQLKENLEHDATTVFQGNWKDRLEKIVRSDVKRFKEDEVCGLLRVIRNKIEHYGRLGEELRAIYLNSPEGVVKYYNDHFPKLLTYTFHHEQDWKRSVGL